MIFSSTLHLAYTIDWTGLIVEDGYAPMRLWKVIAFQRIMDGNWN